MTIKNPWVIIKLILLFVAIYIVLHVYVTSKKPMPTATPPAVITQKPVTRHMAHYITQTGNTVAFNSVDLVARVEGYLDEILFTDGSYVSKGKTLFVIEPKPYLEKLEEAQAAVKAAQAGLDYAKAEHARQKRMYKENATSLNSVEVWLSKEEQAQADVLQSKANLVNAQINYSYTHVEAPFDGRIGRHLVDVGNLVGNGQATKLANIEQIKPMYVYFNLNELDLITLRDAVKKEGITEKNLQDIPIYVNLQGEPQKAHLGHLNFVNTGLNASTGTMELRGILDNNDLTFVPGLFVSVKIPVTSPKPYLTVPATAVLYDQSGPYVFTVNAKHIAHKQPVTLGPLEEERQAIAKGIAPNDDIIVQGLQFATPGKPVAPQRETQGKAS